jgi:hypothetical protein
MRLVTDPEQVQRLAEELQEENWAFRAWIKSNPDLGDEQLMGVVQWLAEDVTTQIDCKTCANCCQVLAPPLDRHDLKRLARALGLDVPTLQVSYLRQDKPGKWELAAPCPLLDGKLCRVYDVRPKPCREYPHLHNDFRSHSIARINDTFLCPIVFNVVEGMKVELDWYDNDKLDWFD